MSVNEEKKRFPVNLDLNERERTRFAETFRQVGKKANEVAEAIEKNDDADITFHYIMFTLMVGSTNEFATILRREVEKIQKSDPDFPEFINRL